jgi:aryl-alcohol dehydrogenase-like predicted oxidoreductase
VASKVLKTLAQGALAYLWARSDRTVPVPGCRTVAQVDENARALEVELGPLTPGELAEVESLLSGQRGGEVGRERGRSLPVSSG